MSETSVTQYGEIARALRLIADRVEASGADGLVPCTYAVISLIPDSREPQDERVATVDALATVLLGSPGQEAPSGSGWHHAARGDVGPVEVSVHTGVTGPAPDAVQAELIALRAEVEYLRSKQTEAGRLVVAMLTPDAEVAS
jgi:hypothetical protein